MNGAQNWPQRKYAWYVVSVLTIAYAIAILDRVSISLLIEPLQNDLQINDTQFGLLQGLAFSLFYSLLGLPMGMWCDRARRVPLLSLGIFLWSAATICCALANNFAELFFARMLVGVGEAALVPCAASLIADYFDPESRPKAYGTFVTGSSLGTAAAMALSGLFLLTANMIIRDFAWAADMKEWQIVFILCGSPGIILSFLLFFTVKEPKRQGVVQSTQKFTLQPILDLFRRYPKAMTALLLGTVLNLVCVYAIVGWIPALFIRVHGWNASDTGWILGAIGMPISIFAAVNSGWVISTLTKWGHRDAPLLAATASSASIVLFGTLTCLVSSPALALVGYGLNALFLNWNISGVYSGIAQIIPNELRGQVMAIHTICSGLIALTAGNFMVGYLSDNIFAGTGGVAWSLAVVFVSCGLASIFILLNGRADFRKASAETVVQ